MEKHYLISKLEGVEIEANPKTKEDLISSYIPLAMKAAKSAHYKRGLPYDDAVELSLYYLTEAVNTAPKISATYLRKYIGSRVSTAIFEDKTIRVPMSSARRQVFVPETSELNEVAEKVPELLDVDHFISQFGFTPAEEFYLTEKLAGSKETEIATALKMSRRDVYRMREKLKEKA